VGATAGCVITMRQRVSARSRNRHGRARDRSGSDRSVLDVHHSGTSLCGSRRSLRPASGGDVPTIGIGLSRPWFGVCAGSWAGRSGAHIDSMSNARTIVLLVAVILAGTLAGFFLTYAFTIMPGLETTDDRTFVEAFQGLERMFGTFDYGYNWPVIFGFLCGPLVIVGAFALNRSRPIVWWLVAALVLSIATIVITQSFNVPLNDEIRAAGDPNMIDAVQVRADFRESWWRAWNLVRSATSVGAFVCLGWALFLHGKTMKN
jgi:uncharacterized membrane protein